MERLRYDVIPQVETPRMMAKEQASGSSTSAHDSPHCTQLDGHAVASSRRRRIVTAILLLAGCACVPVIVYGSHAFGSSPSSANGSSSLTASVAQQAGSGRGTLDAFHQSLPTPVVQVMNQSADPCQDFYEYACGSWLQQTDIPADKNVYLRTFSSINDANERVLASIMNGSSWPYVSEYYQSCSNVTAIDAAGAKPLDAARKAIQGTDSKLALFNEIGRLARTGTNFLTDFAIYPDAIDATKYALNIQQGGLTMPDTLYYTDAAMFAKYSPAFHKYAATTFELLGEEESKAEADAQKIVAWEKQLAEMYLPKEELDDARKTYHPMTIAHAKQQYPLLVSAFFSGLRTGGGVESIGDDTQTIVIRTPAFFARAEAFVNSLSLDDLKLFYSYELATHYASSLSEPFRANAFAFFGEALSGQQERTPNWKLCLRATTRTLPTLVGKYFAQRSFDDATDHVASSLIKQIERAMLRTLHQAPWLDEKTREAALKKLNLLSNLVGYPKHPLEYNFTLNELDYWSNVQAISEFELQRQLSRVGAAVDRAEWLMAASDVNAYYTAPNNQIVFPAGILQPPFFDAHRHQAMNFGAIGSVMGHELTHGFDNHGRLFDGYGNMKNWWTNRTEREFSKRAQCLIDQYSSFAVKSLDQSTTLGHINGVFTLAENIADNGGVKLAFEAYRSYLASHRVQTANPWNEDDTHSTSLDVHLDAERLFFLSFGQAFCGKSKDATMTRRLTSDPHSPEHWRVNGVLMNNRDFARVYACPKDSPMNPEHKCELW